MSDNTINSVTAKEGDVYVQQQSINALLAKTVFNGEAQNIIKLTQSVDVSPPPLPTKHSKRYTLIKEYSTFANTKTLLHITGEVGTGKTQVCNLIQQTYPNNVFWFRIREYQDQIKTFLLALVDVISHNDKLFKLFSKKLKIPYSSLLVLDDLPDLHEKDVLKEFIDLINICEKYKIKIISSSNHKLPLNIRQASDLIDSVHIPGFNEEDTVELLEAYSAPQNIISMSPLINVFTNGHPSLIIATVNYMFQENWEIDFDKFFKDKFIENEIENFTTVFNKTVTDEEVKELAYRLNTVGRTVTKDEIRLVSTIEPSIKHPFEKLSTLLNNWIFKESDDEYLISPLLYKLGSKNLQPKVESNIYLSLGNNIFNKQSITPYEATRGITFLIRANEYDLAGVRLFQTLYSLANIEDLKEDETYLLQHFWSGMPFPKEMTLTIQVLLKTMQIVINEKFNKNTESLYQEYLKLLHNLDKDLSLTELISYGILAQFKYKGFFFANKLSELISKTPSEQLEEFNLSMEVDGIPADSIFILDIQSITSYDRFIDWLALVKNTPIQKLLKLFVSDIACDSIDVMIRLLEKQIIQSQSKKNLDKIYHELKSLADFANTNKIRHLWLLSTGSMINCLIETVNPDNVYKEVNHFLKDTESNDEVLILIHKLALTYFDHKDYEKCLKLYEKVIDFDFDAIKYKTLLIDAWTFSAFSYSMLESYNGEKDQYLLNKAISHYRMVDNYDETYYLQLFSENIIMLWHNDKHHNALEKCETLLAELEDNTRVTEESLKTIKVTLGHTLGYFYSILTSGKPPEKTEGGEIYTIPANGLFLNMNKSAATLYDVNKEFIIYYQLYEMFYFLNDSEKGFKYLIKSYELSLESDLESIKLLLLIDYYLINYEMEKYFTFLNSKIDELGQEGVVFYLYLSLIKLLNENIENKEEIEKYKLLFTQFFSDTLDEEYLKVVLYTLDYFLDTHYKLEIEQNYIIQIIYFLSRVYSSSLSDILKIHNKYYTDFVESSRITNATMYEVFTKYIFNFWINKINNNYGLFSYPTALLKRISELSDTKDEPRKKIKSLLKLMDSYRKK